MKFFESVKNNRKLIIQLGKNEFKNKFANTSLGAIWGFVNPFVFMITYVIVFQYILKIGSSGDLPYIVWFLPGMAMWMFINESILSGSSSIRNYSYLVKKVVFPVEIIPVISLCSSSIIGLFLIIISTIVCCIYGFIPNFVLLIYILLAAYSLILSINRFTSTICTIIPDFSQLLSVVMQLFFWFTPIVWNLDMLEGNEILLSIMNCFPFTYLVNCIRNVFTGSDVILGTNLIPTIVFWSFTIIIYVWGNAVFNKNRKDFADVL